jgi:hypothetical protein
VRQEQEREQEGTTGARQRARNETKKERVREREQYEGFNALDVKQYRLGAVCDSQPPKPVLLYAGKLVLPNQNRRNALNQHGIQSHHLHALRTTLPLAITPPPPQLVIAKPAPSRGREPKTELEIARDLRDTNESSGVWRQCPKNNNNNNNNQQQQPTTTTTTTTTTYIHTSNDAYRK